MSNWAKRDQQVIWHPYTQMKTALAPIPIVRGEGAYLYDESGNRYLDAVSSWWVTIHGHSHPYIAHKVAEQLSALEHVIFAGFTHPAAVELAERLLKILPHGQSRIFYSDNGSTAVEVALKMCLQYWSNKGESRNGIIALEHSYHGDTFGAMAVSARSAFTRPFEEHLFHVEYVDAPSAGTIDALEKRIKELAPAAAAIIFEPLVQGAGGMLMYEPACLDQLIRICRNNNLLVIADEVMTGFGRTGKLFAMDHLKEKPDIVCMSKGITGGTMALGATSCTQQIYDAFLSDDQHQTLFHGHSFTANPVACSAALASLDLLLSGETLSAIQRISDRHRKFAATIRDHPKLKNVRQTGTIIAMEWNTGEEASYFASLRDDLYHFFLERNILLRPLGNIIYILPPYCITDDELDNIYISITAALAEF
jgi:adenosylmethionine-8-amino-7-oxononanoate aminotransferase